MRRMSGRLNATYDRICHTRPSLMPHIEFTALRIMLVVGPLEWARRENGG